MSGPLGNRYRIGASIGRGGAGEVFRGGDDQSDDYAIKVLRPDLAADPKLVARVMGSQFPLLSVRTPHLVAVHDLLVEGQLPAIVMELVPGGNLRHLLHRGPVAPQEVARLGAGIARGLAEAHGVGAAHGDLKPENVLIDYRHNPSRPRLTDVGLSHAVAGAGGVRVGSPHYRAPELWRGAEPTAASDLYGLGILLYELACGVTPYVGEQVALMERHLTSAPGRPAGVAEWLWAVITELTALDPARRGSADQIAHRLDLLVPLLVGAERAPRLLTPPPPVPRRAHDRPSPAPLAEPAPPAVVGKPAQVAEKPAPVAAVDPPPVVAVSPPPVVAVNQPPVVAVNPPPVVAIPAPVATRSAVPDPKPARVPAPAPEPPLRRPAVSREPESARDPWPAGARSGLLAGAAALTLLVGGGALWAAGGEDGATTAAAAPPQVPVVVAPVSPTPSSVTASPSPSAVTASPTPAPTAKAVRVPQPVQVTAPERPSTTRVLATPATVSCEPFRPAADGGLARTVRREDAAGGCRVDVRMVQQALGLSPVNGYFGPLTQQALRTYQLEHCPSFPEPGVIDRWTWDSVVRGRTVRCPGEPAPTPTPSPRPTVAPPAPPTSEPEPTPKPSATPTPTPKSTAGPTPTPVPTTTPSGRPTAASTAPPRSEPLAEPGPRPTSRSVPTGTATPAPTAVAAADQPNDGAERPAS